MDTSMPGIDLPSFVILQRSTEVPPSGKQLASDFLHGRLDGSIVSVYLHKTQTYHYRPYDLHPVPDDKVE